MTYVKEKKQLPGNYHISDVVLRSLRLSQNAPKEHAKRRRNTAVLRIWA
jgi:hypothetical protein